MRLTDNNGTASRTTAAMLRRHTRVYTGRIFRSSPVVSEANRTAVLLRNSFFQRRKVKAFCTPSYFLGQCLRFVFFREIQTTLIHSKRPFGGRLGDTSQMVLIPFEVIKITVSYINSVLNINKINPKFFYLAI